MGYIFGMSRKLIKHDRLCSNRLCVDVQGGDVHLHYRDLRVEMSIREWEVFSKFITQVTELVKVADKEKEFKQFYENLPNSSSDFFPDCIGMETNGKGTYHLHYHEIRWEFDEPIFKLIHNLINSLAIGRFRRLKLKDILVHILVDGEPDCVPFPIIKSPYYLSLLNNDKDIYDAYVSYWELRVSGCKIISFKEQWNLFEKIRDEGFNFEDEFPILLKNDEDVVIDGHHRLCALYVIYGPEKELLFRNAKAYAFVEEHP